MDAIIEAFVALITGMRFLGFLAGVFAGLVVGALPGMGETAAAALLIPFIIRSDPYTAITTIVAALAVVHSSDTVSSVVLGAPGSAAAVPTMLEGHAMAMRGEAGRALAAAYLSSLIGGIMGAVGLSLVIPIARPLVLSFGSAELFLLVALGLCLAGTLAGRDPLRGSIAMLFGLLLGAVGGAPTAPEYRYTFNWLYLEDGIKLVVVALGLYAVPEVIFLLARGGAVSREIGVRGGWLDGLKDVIRHRWLVLRGSLIGMWAGILPVLGASAGTWMAYGHVVASSRDRDRFGKGDIRGIIAPEAANSSVIGGDLIPTLLFGVPGSIPMAMLLGVMVLQGILPGPRVFSEHLQLIYSVIWTLALANVLGAAVLFAASPLFARLTFVPFGRLAPFIITIVVLAAWQATNHWGDILLLLLFGFLGYVMKVFGWPRASLLMGFVLSDPAERYFWLAVNIYPRARDWFMRPGVLVIGALIVATLVWFGVYAVRGRSAGVGAGVRVSGKWWLWIGNLVTLGFAGLFIYAVWEARHFLPSASLFPLAASIPGAVLGGVQLMRQLRGRSAAVADEEEEVDVYSSAFQRKAGAFFMVMIVYSILIGVFGFRLASAVWILGFLRFVGKMGWFGASICALGAAAGVELLAVLMHVNPPLGFLHSFVGFF